jgi:hypothetical protein
MHFTHQVVVYSSKPIRDDTHAEQLVREQACPLISILSASDYMALSPYWFECFSVGKVGKPYYHNSQKERTSYISLSHPGAAQYLDRAHYHQEKAFLTVTDMLKGSLVIAADANGRVLGIPVAETEDEANYRTVENKKMQGSWQALLNAQTLSEAGDASNMGSGFWFLLDEVKMALDLLNGQWHPESMFYAPMFRTSSVENFLMNIKGYSEEDKQNLYLISVKFTL